MLPLNLGVIFLLIGARTWLLNLLTVTGFGAGNPATLFGWLFSGLTVDVFDCIEFKDWF